MGKSYGIISIKGGVGKTTAVTNLGAALAKNFGKKVIIIDGNFSAPNLGLHVGVVNPKKHLHGVIHHGHNLAEAVHEHEHGFHLLPSSLISNKKIDRNKFRAVVRYLKNKYDYVLIDSSPNLNEEMLTTMTASDELLVVTTPDFPTLSTTMRAVKIARQRKTPITGLILNKVRNKKFELTLEEIEDATKTPVLAVLPDDVKVLESLAHSTPVTVHSPWRKVATNYKKLAGTLIKEDYKEEKKGFFEKIKGLFSSKDISKDEVNRLLKNS